MNQQLLDVGHKSLTSVYHICRSHELSCKLTGTGGGGCAFAIVRPGELCVCVCMRMCCMHESVCAVCKPCG